jgi:hypothetical protein
MMPTAKAPITKPISVSFFITQRNVKERVSRWNSVWNSESECSAEQLQMADSFGICTINNRADFSFRLQEPLKRINLMK